MKIQNESVTIRLGNRERTFKNLILNSYLDLFADSFLKFKNKAMDACFIKFDTPQVVDEDSTNMEYDLVLQTDPYKTKETYTENTIINDYIYNVKATGFKDISEFVGHQITAIGFGTYDYYEENTMLYAFLDISRYQIYVQDGQEIIISRKDKITSDLLFYSPFKEVKYPTHLTTRGILEIKDMEYDEIFSQLYSLGLGTLYNVIEEEIPLEELDIKKEGIGTIIIESAKNYASYPSTTLFPSTSLFPGRTPEGLKKLEIKNKGEGLYPSLSLYPSKNSYPKQATQKWVIYKFKLYRKRYEGEKEIIEDTGSYYFQAQRINQTGSLKLNIKYERKD